MSGKNTEAILVKDKALDFDDLLLKTAQLLEKYKDVREHYNAVWKYIHIDEYQDTNRVQYKIAKLLAEKSVPNICVVGDADQNIYSWRGATIENILNFRERLSRGAGHSLGNELPLNQDHHHRRQQHHRQRMKCARRRLYAPTTRPEKKYLY